MIFLTKNFLIRKQRRLEVGKLNWSRFEEFELKKRIWSWRADIRPTLVWPNKPTCRCNVRGKKKQFKFYSAKKSTDRLRIEPKHTGENLIPRRLNSLHTLILTFYFVLVRKTADLILSISLLLVQNRLTFTHA